jgi:mono/diheme cytochrome c family protein
MRRAGHGPISAIVALPVAIVAAALCEAALVRILAQPAGGGTAIDERVQRGKATFEKRCVECHGRSGHGDGPAAPHLSPAPRDFASGKYKIRSTESGSVPTDEDLIRSVRQGLYGSAMPAWDGLLANGDVVDVVEYIKSLSPRFKTSSPQVVTPATQVASSPQSISRGRDAYEKLQCGKCHGTDGRGTGAVATAFTDDWNQPMRAADLTEPWTFHGGSTSRDVYMRFRTGMSGTPMPSFKDAASDLEMWDIANYVVSLARTPVWSMTAQEVTDLFARQDEAAKADPIGRGHDLVDSLGCPQCHSPFDENKQMWPGMRLAGGLLIRIEPFGDYPTGNLTSDKETGLGNWTDDQIKQVITRGVLPDGTRLLPYPMDYASFSTLEPGDLNAIVAYLRTVPPVSNRVPKPARRFLPAYLWGKFRMLVLGNDPPIVFYPGNAGIARRR